MAGIKAALFDIDGTLIDSNDLNVAAWFDAFQEAGIAIARDAIHGQIGKGGDNLLPALAPHCDKAEQERLKTRQGEIFKANYIARAKPFPGARALLERVRETGAKVVLASSAAREQLDHYIGLMDAHDLIDAVTSIDDVESSKPAPDIFATALRKAGVASGEAVAIGDTPYDIEAAGKAGVGTIALLSGGFAAETLSGAIALYDDAADLLARFDQSPLAA
ncbi:HAD family hydrolase [Sphingomonas crusticola]|uniref:HAD family hydrolase n=1 Tax=Sphingomonas crusticola TaxID=1697973 RepID=UPI000E289DF9|nr:HAD family hydrolase [Sphingomonas crusticola]